MTSLSEIDLLTNALFRVEGASTEAVESAMDGWTATRVPETIVAAKSIEILVFKRFIDRY